LLANISQFILVTKCLKFNKKLHIRMCAFLLHWKTIKDDGEQQHKKIDSFKWNFSMNFYICLTELPESGLSFSTTVRWDLIKRNRFENIVYCDISKSKWDTGGSVANVSSSVVTDYSSGSSTHWWRPRRRRMQHQLARLYHDNEFSGVYDHATSSNPPLPSRPCTFVCMRGMLRYATLYLHFALRASQQRREWRNFQAVSTDFLRIDWF